MKRDLLVLVPYPEKDLAQLQAAAGDLRVVTLPETAPEVQLRQALESARAVIGEPPVALLQDLPELAWIQMTWAGADRYTSDPAFPQHVRLSVAAGVYGPTIAEHVLAMLLALNRRLPAYQLQQRQGGWEDLGSERVPAAGIRRGDHRRSPHRSRGDDPRLHYCDDPVAAGPAAPPG